MSLRKTLALIQYGSLTVALVSLSIVLFTVGDTDFGAQAPPPPVTLTFAALAGIGALVGAPIQRIGLRIPEKEDKHKGKARALTTKVEASTIASVRALTSASQSFPIDARSSYVGRDTQRRRRAG